MNEFSTVERVFHKIAPQLLASLGNTGAFWSRIADNSIPNQELRDVVGFHTDDSLSSQTYLAALVVLLARQLGELPNPG
jgi:hypothetical protein